MYFILRNPFWPSLMAITVVLAAIGAGWPNAKRVGPKWVLHSLGYYALPALIVVFLGFNYASSTYDTSDFFRCRDAVCKAAAADNANHDYWIKLALVELAALALLGATAWLRQWIIERREFYPPTLNGASKGGRLSTTHMPGGFTYKQSEWSLDPETGEYHRIVFRHGSDTLINTETYEDRLGAALKKIRDHQNLVKTIWISWPVALTLLIVFESSEGGYAFLWGLLLGIVGVTAIATTACAPFSSFGVAKAKGNVGPRPITPQGLNELQEQAERESDRVAHRQKVEAALKQKAASQGVRYED